MKMWNKTSHLVFIYGTEFFVKVAERCIFAQE